MSLFAELNRRNVLRVGVFYAVAGWLVLQVGQLLFEVLDVPPWGIKLVLGILILGFPIALICAWVFEVTEHGIKWESEIDRTESITPQTARRLDIMTMVLLVGVVSLFLIDRVVHPTFSDGRPPQAIEPPPAPQGPRDEGGGFESGVPPAPELAEERSVAVLPFVSMSSGEEDEYFADGLTEEILNTLVKVPKLLVAARTSSFAYKGQNKDIRVIGQELGVEHIVEGSVRKAGDALRITAQLIRVTDGFHLWSETYDRKLENVFVIQEEIARAVAESLQVPLGLSSDLLVVNRTTDMQAYELYLKARQWIRMRDARLGDGIVALEQVVAREPDFAPAWAMLSISRGLLASYVDEFQGQPTDAETDEIIAERAARRAVALDDNLAEAHYALANVLRTGLQWAAAEDEYARALSLDPRSIEILEDYRQLYVFTGHLGKAKELSRRAYQLDPQLPLAVISYADTLWFARQYEQAEELIQALLVLGPGFSWSNQLLIEMRIDAGRYREALDLLDSCAWCLGRGEAFKHLPVILEALAGGREVPLSREQLLESGFSSVWFILGDQELVLDGIEKWKAGHINNGFMDQVRMTERYGKLVLDMGLVDYWKERGWPDYCWPVGDNDFECGAFKQ